MKLETFLKLCTKIFLCFLVCLLVSSCVSKKHSVKTTTKTVTDSLVQVQVQRDTIYWHGVQVTNEKVSVTVSRWDAESNQWQPETKTDTERNTEVENKDTISEKTELITTDYSSHTEEKQQEKEVEQKGVRWNILDVISCLCGVIVVIVLVFGPKNRIKNL